MALKLMVLLLVLKLIGVVVSYASGNAGGIFGPALFLGAMLGGAVGSVAHNLFPGHVATAGAYALVGMGTTFAGIVRAPMTSVVMIFETTRDYSVIVPLMISNLVSFFVSSRFQHQPIYEVLAYQDGIHLPSAESRISSGQRRVFQAMRRATEILTADMTIQDALEKARDSRLEALPVNNDRGVAGIVKLATLEKASADGDSNKKLTDLIEGEEFPHLHADQSLTVALERM
jgi:CIC family chloride channel protein